MQRVDQALAELLVRHSYLHRQEGRDEPFRLASGRTSFFYFDCQLTTMRAEAIELIGHAFWRRLLPTVKSVGGLTRGADPIAHGIAGYSALRGKRCVDAFSVRKQQKTHGTGKWIEGVAAKGARVAVVDDVITSGKSVITAVDHCRDEGLEVLQVIVLVDREEGGLPAIQEHVGPSVSVERVFTKSGLDGIWRALDGEGPQTGGASGAAKATG
jgi:orotate phosphoribosyltransferase